MKKTYVLVLLVLLVAFLSQSVVYATDNENDYQKVIELSREKLGNQRVTVQLMDGLNSYERFYLAEGVESGYLIYDRDNGIFLEYSAEDSSPCGNYVLRAHLGLAQAPGMPIYCASCGYEMDDGE